MFVCVMERGTNTQRVVRSTQAFSDSLFPLAFNRHLRPSLCVSSLLLVPLLQSTTTRFAMPRPPLAAMATARSPTPQSLGSPRVLQVGRKRLAKPPSKSEQQTWKDTQKHNQLHEQRTRIILDNTGHVLPHRSHDLPPSTPQPAPETSRSEQRREDRVEPHSGDLLAERYEAMKVAMQEETATLRSTLALSNHSTTPPPVVDGEVLPPTTSPLLGTFSPHLVSHHLPTLFSYPVFHFGRGQLLTQHIISPILQQTIINSQTVLSRLSVHRRLSTAPGVLLHAESSPSTPLQDQPTTLVHFPLPLPRHPRLLLRLPHWHRHRPPRLPLRRPPPDRRRAAAVPAAVGACDERDGGGDVWRGRWWWRWWCGGWWGGQGGGG